MVHNYRFCDFTWNAWEGNFKNVLVHEKTHRKTSRKQNFKSTLLILAVVSLATLIVVQAPIQSFADVQAPKKQTKLGIDQTDIICKTDLVKVYRINIDKIDCFTISSVQKLTDRGLIKEIPKEKLELKESFKQVDPIGTITKVATLNQFGENNKFSSTFRTVEYLHVFEVCAKDKSIRAPQLLITSDSEAKTIKLAQKIIADKCYTTAAKIKATDPNSITASLTNKGMITDKLFKLEEKIADIKEKIAITKIKLATGSEEDISALPDEDKQKISLASTEIIQLRKELNQVKGELNKYLFVLHAPPQLKASEFLKQEFTFTGMAIEDTSVNIMTVTPQTLGTRSQENVTGDAKLYNVVFEACSGKEEVLRVPEVKITSDSEEKIVRIAEKIIANSCQMSTVKVNAMDTNSIKLIMADRSDISSNIIDLEKELGRLLGEQVKYQTELNQIVVQSQKDEDYEDKVSELSNSIIQLRKEIKDVKFRLYGSIYEVYKNP